MGDCPFEKEQNAQLLAPDAPLTPLQSFLLSIVCVLPLLPGQYSPTDTCQGAQEGGDAETVQEGRRQQRWPS